MNERKDVDATWVLEVIEALASPTTTSTDVQAILDRAGVAGATLTALPHLKMDIRLEVRLSGSLPVTLLEQRIGAAEAVPSCPDDFHSGPIIVFYDLASGSPYMVRLFAELNRGDATRVVKLEIDRERLPADWR